MTVDCGLHDTRLTGEYFGNVVLWLLQYVLTFDNISFFVAKYS